MREIGIVKSVQIQRSSLKSGQKPTQTYDPAPLLVVDSLMLSPQGVTGLTADGGRMLDVHHAAHPNTRSSGANGVSVGFTGHYAHMRSMFGAHLTDGIAGENILVEANGRFALADLGKRLGFQNPVTGEITYLDKLLAAPPCEPFSRFALCQAPPVVAEVMKATLQFLDAGTRGFYATGQSGTVHVGDRVLAVDTD